MAYWPHITYRAFSLTWAANCKLCKFIGTKESVYTRKKFNYQDRFRTPTWPPFYCFTTWRTWRHLKRFYTLYFLMNPLVTKFTKMQKLGKNFKVLASYAPPLWRFISSYKKRSCFQLRSRNTGQPILYQQIFDQSSLLLGYQRYQRYHCMRYQVVLL